MGKEKIRRYGLTVAAFVLGSGMVGGWLQANVQEWAKANGQDQYLVKYAGPAMDKLAQVTQSEWFIFSAGFIIGGAVFLWAEYFLRRRAQGAAKQKAKPIDPNKLELIEGRLFRNTEVSLDGKYLLKCTLENVTFLYNGAYFRMDYCDLKGQIMWKSEVPEVNAMVQALHSLGFLNFPVWNEKGEILKLGIERKSDETK